MAAIGIIMLMIVGMAVHLRRKEHGKLVVNVVLLLMAVFVAYGRFAALPL